MKEKFRKEEPEKNELVSSHKKDVTITMKIKFKKL